MTGEVGLDDEIAAQIEDLAEEGNVLLDESDDWRGAVRVWQRAIALLPEPPSQWGEAVWLHASIGAAQREGTEVEAALESFVAAYRAAEGHLNPYVLLQLGSLLRTRDESAAVDLLLRGYMLQGSELFEENPDDLAFLADRVELRPEGRRRPWRLWKRKR